VYLFRHVVTQEVAYESLAYGTRAALHNEIGLYLEAQGPEAAARQVDLLAFHFDRGENVAKRRHYLLKAGEAAQARYANPAAISYYQRALPLLEPAEQVTVRLKLGRVLELVGNWSEANRIHDAALALATRLGDLRAQAAVHAAKGELRRKRGQYAEATASLALARTLYGQARDEAGIAEVLHFLGSVAGQQGNYDEAFELYRQSLEIRRRLGDKTGIASLFSNLGIIAWFSGHFDEARAYYESALHIRREVGDRWAIANSLNNLGLVLRDLGEVAEARSLLEQALLIGREIGDRWSVANTLSSLGDVALSQNDLTAAHGFLLESLTIGRELNDRHGLTFLLEYFAVLAAKRQRPETAETLVGAASALRAALGAPLSPTERARLDASLAEGSTHLASATREALRQAGRDLGDEGAMNLAVASCAG
jgi:tetratricopeptide (TPR) repeat protein